MTNNNYTRYVVLINNIPNMTNTEALIKAHVAHLKKLEAQGKIELCGPFIDFNGGMVIYKNCTLEDAHKFAQDDPFIAQKCKTYQIRTMELSCAQNNHLGMG